MILLSAFGGGLWIIPVGLLLAAIWSAYRGVRSSQSNSRIQNRDGSYTNNTGNVPYLKTGGGVFSIIFLLAAIGSAIWMINEK